MTMTSQIVLPTKPQESASLPSLSDRLISIVPNLRKIIVFSPHLDDAVLSMGAFLSQLDKSKYEIEIINIFTAGSSLNSPNREGNG